MGKQIQKVSPDRKGERFTNEFKLEAVRLLEQGGRRTTAMARWRGDFFAQSEVWTATHGAIVDNTVTARGGGPGLPDDRLLWRGCHHGFCFALRHDMPRDMPHDVDERIGPIEMSVCR